MGEGNGKGREGKERGGKGEREEEERDGRISEPRLHPPLWASQNLGPALGQKD